MDTVPVLNLNLFQSNRVKLAEVARLVTNISCYGLKTPVRIAEIPEGWLVLDGLHRVLACRSLGWENINVEIIPGNVASMVARYDLSSVLSSAEQQLERYDNIVKNMRR